MTSRATQQRPAQTLRALPAAKPAVPSLILPHRRCGSRARDAARPSGPPTGARGVTRPGPSLSRPDGRGAGAVRGLPATARPMAAGRRGAGRRFNPAGPGQGPYRPRGSLRRGILLVPAAAAGGGLRLTRREEGELRFGWALPAVPPPRSKARRFVISVKLQAADARRWEP
ncbi:translation initiation factor IF-2-like [Manacus candei]|uniref:translation initiation factor IF-2-like n=1 Tax=Manacus candei TaxID=415023 RepID=UPI002227F7D4|nr:translation initiation factor IF-2-like [Manacus candei]